jgi:hypothetical protein
MIMECYFNRETRNAYKFFVLKHLVLKLRKIEFKPTLTATGPLYVICIEGSSSGSRAARL